MQLLLHAGSNLHIKSNNGETPLHVAASNSRCNPEVFGALLSAGADVGAISDGGLTPLHIAVKNGDSNDQIVAMLLGAGTVHQTWILVLSGHHYIWP